MSNWKQIVWPVKFGTTFKVLKILKFSDFFSEECVESSPLGEPPGWRSSERSVQSVCCSKSWESNVLKVRHFRCWNSKFNFSSFELVLSLQVGPEEDAPDWQIASSNPFSLEQGKIKFNDWISIDRFGLRMWFLCLEIWDSKTFGIQKFDSRNWLTYRAAAVPLLLL